MVRISSRLIPSFSEFNSIEEESPLYDKIVVFFDLVDITCNLKCGAGEGFVYIPFTHIVVKPVCGAHGVLYHTCTFLHQNNFAVKLRNQKKKVLVSPCMFSTQETELVMAETEQEKDPQSAVRRSATRRTPAWD